MNQERAKQILEAHELKSGRIQALHDLDVQVYGNKGRMWTNTACITELDAVKAECNPRLAHNYCESQHVGCPKCLATLRAIAEGVELNAFNSEGVES
jgi:hypothetical protein